MKFWIILLSIWQVCGAQSGSSTIGLTVEDAEFSVAKATEEIRASLVFTMPITQTKILETFAILTTIATEWKNSSCFEGTSPLKDQLFNALEPGREMLEILKAKYLRFYMYLQTSTAEPVSTCIFETKMFNDLIITEEPKQLVSMRTGIILTGTAAEIWGRKETVRAAAEFSMAYNAVIAALGSELDESLSNLNLLSELEFPQNLRGNLETLSCLSNTGTDFEKIKVLNCKKATEKFICEITVFEPETITTYIKLIPVIYDDVRLWVPSNSFLVKDGSNNKINLLDCDDEQAKLPICVISSKMASCTKFLEQHDLESSIQACSFEYCIGDFAIRLGNEAILVHGQHLSTLDGTVAVIQRPPLLIFSNNEIKISSLEEERSFKPALTVVNPRIETTKLTGPQITAIKIKAYWAQLWDYIMTSEMMSYLNPGLEFLFGPLTIVGLILSCRKRSGGKKIQKKVMKKRSRKENYQSNMELLERKTRKTRR